MMQRIRRVVEARVKFEPRHEPKRRRLEIHISSLHQNTHIADRGAPLFWMCFARYGMNWPLRGYATISSGKSLRSKGPLLSLEHVRRAPEIQIE